MPGGQLNGRGLGPRSINDPVRVLPPVAWAVHCTNRAVAERLTAVMASAPPKVGSLTPTIAAANSRHPAATLAGSAAETMEVADADGEEMKPKPSCWVVCAVVHGVGAPRGMSRSFQQ